MTPPPRDFEADRRFAALPGHCQGEFVIHKGIGWQKWVTEAAEGWPAALDEIARIQSLVKEQAAEISRLCPHLGTALREIARLQALIDAWADADKWDSEHRAAEDALLSAATPTPKGPPDGR